MTTDVPTLAAIRRAEQMFHEHIGEKQTLQYGIAYHSREFADSAEDNAFREVLVESEAQAQDAWCEAEQFYQDRDLVCRLWVPSAAQSIDVLRPLFQQRDWIPRQTVAMRLERWPDLEAKSKVRVLPARAMRKAFRQLHEPDSSDLAERRLDYAQYDVSVAIMGNQPAGRCGLLQVGEIGNVRDLFVNEPLRQQGVGTALMVHVLALARRLMMRVVCLKVDSTDSHARAFFEGLGFEVQGELMEFYRPRNDKRING